MLSLPPPFQGAAAERQAACRLLLQAAKAQGVPGGSLPLLPGKPAAGDGGIDLSAIVAAAPQKCAVSRFFGRTGPDGAPLLAPAPREPASLGSSRCGACRAAVGDALPLQLVVRTRLPEALPLRDVVLTLAVLQEMTGGGLRLCNVAAAASRWLCCAVLQKMTGGGRWPRTCICACCALGPSPWQRLLACCIAAAAPGLMAAGTVAGSTCLLANPGLRHPFRPPLQ